jgi:hypothetical protein
MHRLVYRRPDAAEIRDATVARRHVYAMSTRQRGITTA